MNYFRILDKEMKGAKIIYPFSKVASVFTHFQENTDYILVIMDNGITFNIDKDNLNRYLEFLNET